MGKRPYRYSVLLITALVCLGAWWDRAETKKTALDSEKVVEDHETQFAEDRSAEKEIAQVSASEKTPGIQKIQVPDVARIQKDLKEIINRSRHLQLQVNDNRSEIQGMMERARIHEQILKTISIPKPVRVKKEIEADEIVKREKLRLIAEQARKTQEQLRHIQEGRSLKPAEYVPADGAASKTS